MRLALVTMQCGYRHCERIPTGQSEYQCTRVLIIQSLTTHRYSSTRLVPVLAVGFPEVKARLEMQQAETERQSVKMSDLRKRLDDLSTKHTLSNSVRIAAISRKQTSLHHRLISIARKIHLLIPALRGQSVTLREEQLKSILQNCELELESISLGADGRGSANYTTRLRGRINELWALLGNVKAKREAVLASEGNANQLEWAVVDESALDDVAKVSGEIMTSPCSLLTSPCCGFVDSRLAAARLRPSQHDTAKRHKGTCYRHQRLRGSRADGHKVMMQYYTCFILNQTQQVHSLFHPPPPLPPPWLTRGHCSVRSCPFLLLFSLDNG
jgi:hypothetical protein